MNKHTFEISGLGKAPFKASQGDPNLTADLFYCEHCGRMIKNKHFVKSSCGKVSIVGSGCILKTGDAGLIAGHRRVVREAKAAARAGQIEAANKAREAQERERYNGKNKAEHLAQVQQLRQELRQQTDSALADTLFYKAMQAGIERFSNFCFSMYHNALDFKPFTAGQRAAILDVITKHQTEARKNSNEYKRFLPAAEADLQKVEGIIQAAALIDSDLVESQI